MELEPVVLSRTNMLQISVPNIYLMPRNLGLAHAPPRGSRALWHKKSELRNTGRGVRQRTLLEIGTHNIQVYI